MSVWCRVSSFPVFFFVAVHLSLLLFSRLSLHSCLCRNSQCLPVSCISVLWFNLNFLVYFSSKSFCWTFSKDTLIIICLDSFSWGFFQACLWFWVYLVFWLFWPDLPSSPVSQFTLVAYGVIGMDTSHLKKSLFLKKSKSLFFSKNSAFLTDSIQI